jgi:lysozyme
MGQQSTSKRHRSISREGREFIARWEGFRTTRYLDVAGLPTIGWGHLIRPGELIPDPITEGEADELLVRDLYHAEKGVLRLVGVPLSDGQFDALGSFTFNLGSGALQRSRLRLCINRGDLEAAGQEFPRWCLAGGRRIPGLLRRRIAEAEMFQS